MNDISLVQMMQEKNRIDRKEACGIKCLLNTSKLIGL